MERVTEIFEDIFPRTAIQDTIVWKIEADGMLAVQSIGGYGPRNRILPADVRSIGPLFDQPGFRPVVLGTMTFRPEPYNNTHRLRFGVPGVNDWFMTRTGYASLLDLALNPYTETVVARLRHRILTTRNPSGG